MSGTSINPGYTIEIDIGNIDHVKTLRIQCYNCDSSCGFETSNHTLTALLLFDCSLVAATA